MVCSPLGTLSRSGRRARRTPEARRFTTGGLGLCLGTLISYVLQTRYANKDADFYWLAIIAAAAVFGIGHLPLLFSLIAQPTILLIGLIIALNLILGVIAGWLH
ncbi:MAG: hypothetical protein KI793_27280 [Rivularia sp. (in: Bacteria)]|nr:hypothetical protein [Rivularia sp. MS3]